MKKGLFLFLILAASVGCKKECGCLEPVKSWQELVPRYINGQYMRTDIVYYGKYRDMCGNTRTVAIGQGTFEKWPNVAAICD